MKVNNAYAEEIAKRDGGKAAKPFRVLWDDPESGADLKVVYRTPKFAGTIMLAIGMAAIAFASYCGWRCFHEVNYNVLIGFCIIFAFGIGMTVSGLRTSWTRMEYEFKRGICTVRYALAGLLRREWSFAYNDKTGAFAYMRPMSDMFATVPEYGFTDNEGGILFRTKQAMKIPHYDYFSLVVAGYLSRNEDEEQSRQVLSSIRLERNLRDKSTAKKMWIFLCIIIAISVTMSIISNRNKPTKEEQLAEKDDITATLDIWSRRSPVRRDRRRRRRRALSAGMAASVELVNVITGDVVRPKKKSPNESSSNRRTKSCQITEQNHVKSPNVIDLRLQEVIKYAA